MKKVALIALLIAPIPALATPIEWKLDGRLLQDGSVTGSFVGGADTVTFTDILLRTEGSSSGGLEVAALQLNGIFESSLANAGGALAELGNVGRVSRWNFDGDHTPIRTPTISVDEPGALALFIASGLLGVVIRRRRATDGG